MGDGRLRSLFRRHHDRHRHVHRRQHERGVRRHRVRVPVWRRLLVRVYPAADAIHRRGAREQDPRKGPGPQLSTRQHCHVRQHVCGARRNAADRLAVLSGLCWVELRRGGRGLEVVR